MDKSDFDKILQGKISAFIRERDLLAIRSGYITTVEEFRNVKLTSYEFSRFAYQIIFEESIRKMKEVFIISYVTSVRNKAPGHDPYL